jgi:hypothetical protein
VNSYRSGLHLQLAPIKFGTDEWPTFAIILYP